MSADIVGERLRKVLRKYMNCRKRLKAHKLKMNCNSMSLMKLWNLLLQNLYQYEAERKEKEL